ncbi:hypothetical protein CR513_13312, partial [Mucuna pruriens]
MVTLMKELYSQPENFVSIGSKSMASHQWYHKFHKVITSYCFEANVVDDFVLYIDDILLVSSDMDLLHETKRFLMKNFDMKELMKASFVFGIQILREHFQDILRLS